MSCVEIPDDHRHVLETIAEAVTVATGDLPAGVVGDLEAIGWVYRHNGQAGLTGAGAWHTSTGRSSAGMLERR